MNNSFRLAVLAGSVNGGLLNTLKETPGTYPFMLWQHSIPREEIKDPGLRFVLFFSRISKNRKWKNIMMPLQTDAPWLNCSLDLSKNGPASITGCLSCFWVFFFYWLSGSSVFSLSWKIKCKWQRRKCGQSAVISRIVTTIQSQMRFLSCFFADLAVLFTFDRADLSLVLRNRRGIAEPPAVHLLNKWPCVTQGQHPWLVFLTLLYCAGTAGVFLHPLVCGGTDRLPHLPDLPQPDDQWRRKCNQ